MCALHAEGVQDVDDAAYAFLERECRCELLTFAETGRVDQHHPMATAEVVGLALPQITRHQQARPEHHRLAAAVDLYPHRAEHGGDPVFLHARDASAPT